MTQPNRFKKKPDEIIINNWILARDFGIPYEAYRDLYNEMNNSIKEVAITNDVICIYLAQKVPQESGYMYDSVHLNDHGSKYVSRLVADRLAIYLND